MHTICLVFALVLFVVGAFWTPHPRISLISLGLAFLAAAFLVAGGGLALH